MRLFIAEKPSLGRAIAEALPKPLKKSSGFIVAANGDTVTWCIGHLLEQAQPEAYDPAFKKWSHEHLPIIPTRWQLQPKPKTAKQLNVIAKLIKKAKSIVHAGDPDREGQLLVDEVIHYLGVTATQKSTIQRCLINDLTPKAVSQSLNMLRDNREFIALSTSALARSRADWLYGINLTRAYTIQGKQAGYQGVLSVGRVQTPLLGLVVRRDWLIESFVSQTYYEVWATLSTEQGCMFKAKWLPSKACQPYLDEQGRNLSKALAQNVVQRISHQPATVTVLKRTKKSQPAPLPYNLSALQIDANKAFGLSAQQVLDICQTLYERHKLITYPRSDSRYLPHGHFAQAATILHTVAHNAPLLGQQGVLISNTWTQGDYSIKHKSKAWNDSKVDAHHAIIPTSKKTQHLSGREADVYGLISRNYLAQFMSRYEFFDTRVTVNINNGEFVASANELINQGWKSIFIGSTKKPATSLNEQSSALSSMQQSSPALPKLVLNERVNSLQAEWFDKQTSPPKPYTDATLLAAMTGISAHISDPQLKKVLRDTDGLGTEATRASIIELLFTRKYLTRSGKTISSTVTGQTLIKALPDEATYPDMTARWESQLSAIYSGQSTYNTLMAPLNQQLEHLIETSHTFIPAGLNGLGKASFKGKGKFKRRK
ncbi:MAG: DNA topoisomerase III [Glaciecola sp.]|jgi:DNA topoisomerase-3|nr:DNA topoisomerase III [Glaciecola sp.]MDG1814792.1 DNA topoisomerase III [Glaciecola sp.]MDG2098937.1 DNA topoisomerase III [Glaciecola sp.]